MRSNFPAAVPEIPVSDLGPALAYYKNNLGFDVDWVEESIGLAGVSRGECRMFLATSSFRSAYRNAGPVLTWLNLDGKKEVDELYHTWNESGAKVISAPESKPWGLHEFTATDLDGNFLRVFYDFATLEREAS